MDLDISKRSTFYLPSVYKCFTKHLTSHLICDPQTIIQKLIDSSFWKLRFRSSAGDHSIIACLFIPFKLPNLRDPDTRRGHRTKAINQILTPPKPSSFQKTTFSVHLKSRLSLRVAEVEGEGQLQQNTTLNL